MIRVATYHNTVPNKKNQEKIDLLKYFSEGVRVAGDKTLDNYSFRHQLTEVAVIQGWVSQSPSNRPHTKLRNDVISHQLANKQHVVAVDSNLFLYATPSNPLHYLRYSFDSVFPDVGIYCDSSLDPSRWQLISSALGIQLKDYRSNGNHILLCLQRNGGWSMGTFDVQDWAIHTISQLRQYTDRPIVIRAHPGDKAAREYLNPASPQCKLQFTNGIQLSTGTSLIDDLKNCWAAINHNSSPVVAAAIEGVPVFVTDPARSQCRDIANINLAQIEQPQLTDRQPWVERLAMSHWNFDELRSGACWNHMRKFI